MIRLSLLVALAAAASVCGQVVVGKDDGKDLDTLIRQIFTPPPPAAADGRNNGNNDQFRGTTVVGEPQAHCTCVPYYLCQNGTIKTDGEGVIDIRLIFLSLISTG
jgi:hypothetical protein